MPLQNADHDATPSNCKICGCSDRKLVKSHIYPEAFYRRSGDRSTPIVEIDGQNLHRHQSAIYDRFLCGDCEDLFDTWDDHAARFARQLDCGKRIFAPDAKPFGYTYQGIADPHKLRMFALSVLLRAHLSRHRFFTGTNVGRFQSALTSAVRFNNSSAIADFPVFLIRPKGPLADAGVPPERLRIGGINGYLLMPPRLHLFVKVDRRPLDAYWEEVVLDEARPVTVVERSSSMQEIADAVKVVRPHHSRVERIFKRK